MEPCKYEKVIEIMSKDIAEVKGDVKSLLRFKWQVIGGSAVIGFIIYIIFGIIGNRGG
jgi:hypothetical protein